MSGFLWSCVEIGLGRPKNCWSKICDLNCVTQNFWSKITLPNIYIQANIQTSLLARMLLFGFVSNSWQEIFSILEKWRPSHQCLSLLHKKLFQTQPHFSQSAIKKHGFAFEKEPCVCVAPPSSKRDHLDLSRPPLQVCPKSVHIVCGADEIYLLLTFISATKIGWTTENHSLGFQEADRLDAASGSKLGHHNSAPGVSAPTQWNLHSLH